MAMSKIPSAGSAETRVRRGGSSGVRRATRREKVRREERIVGLLNRGASSPEIAASEALRSSGCAMSSASSSLSAGRGLGPMSRRSGRPLPWSAAPDAEEALTSLQAPTTHRARAGTERFFYFFPRNPLKSPDSTKANQAKPSVFAWFYLVCLGGKLAPRLYQGLCRRHPPAPGGPRKLTSARRA
jgi:hypothetical protein